MEMKKRGILIRNITGLGITVLWALILLLVSWAYSHFANLYGLDIVIFFVILLVNLLALIILIDQLNLFEKIEVEKNAIRKNMVGLSILYGILGLIFGVLSCILIVAGHILIYLVGGLAFVANRLMFGPYDIMLVIILASVLIAYVATGIKEGTLYVKPKE